MAVAVAGTITRVHNSCTSKKSWFYICHLSFVICHLSSGGGGVRVTTK